MQGGRVENSRAGVLAPFDNVWQFEILKTAVRVEELRGVLDHRIAHDRGTQLAMLGAAGAIGNTGDERARTVFAEQSNAVVILARGFISQMTGPLQALANV